MYEKRKVKFDGQLLYKENISIHYFEKQGFAEKASPNYYFIRLMRHRGVSLPLKETIEDRVRNELEVKIEEEYDYESEEEEEEEAEAEAGHDENED